MIDSRELRIGNLIYEESAVLHGSNMIQKVKSIAEDLIGVESDLLGIKMTRPQYCKPIPLSPEVLLACGLTTDEYKVEYGIGLPIGEGADLFIEDEGHPSMSCGIKSFPKNFNYFKDIKYLHQLQNLFYSLTGTELNYKP